MGITLSDAVQNVVQAFEPQIKPVAHDVRSSLQTVSFARRDIFVLWKVLVESVHVETWMEIEVW